MRAGWSALLLTGEVAVSAERCPMVRRRGFPDRMCRLPTDPVNVATRLRDLPEGGEECPA